MTAIGEQDQVCSCDTLAVRWADAVEFERDLEEIHAACKAHAAGLVAAVPELKVRLLLSRFDSVFSCEAAVHEFWGAQWMSDVLDPCPRLTRVVSVVSALIGHSAPAPGELDAQLIGRLVRHAKSRFEAQAAARGIAFRFYQHKVGMGLWVSRPQWAESELQVARGVCAGHLSGQARWAMRLVAANDADDGSQAGDELAGAFIHGLDERGLQIFALPEHLEELCLATHGHLATPPALDSPDSGYQLLRA